MNVFTDEYGQGAAEYILLFGGVIVIASCTEYIWKLFQSNKPIKSIIRYK